VALVFLVHVRSTTKCQFGEDFIHFLVNATHGNIVPCVVYIHTTLV